MDDWVAVPRRLAIGARRALDVHEDVAATRFGHQVEHPGVGAAGDVVDRRGPGVERLSRDLGLKGVGGHRHASAPGQLLDRGDEPRGLLTRRDRGPAAGRHGAHVEKVEPASASAKPSSTARSGVWERAPSKNESAVTLTIPAAIGGGNSSVRSARRQRDISGLT